MEIKIRGGKILENGSFEPNTGITVTNGDEDIVLGDSYILPSFCDVHVHFREPNQGYKETIKTGSEAALNGGYTAVCCMPNVKPAPSTVDGVNAQLEIIKRDAVVDVYPYGAITLEQSGGGELADMRGIAPLVCAFSDDGVGVQTRDLMKEAMLQAKELGKLIVAHCEDNELLAQGKIAESEWRQIERDVRLADDTGAAYHVCHISCKESVEIIRDAKKSGVDVTCETAPHYLLLTEQSVQSCIDRTPELGGRFKMNPPLKRREDRDALIRGVQDGTIDILATDHAPHSDEEKSRGWEKSLNGVVGLECAFPVMYTGLVQTEIISMQRLMELMAYKPRERFGITERGYTIVNLDDEFTINSNEFASKGRWTPFDGWKVFGKVETVISNGTRKK